MNTITYEEIIENINDLKDSNYSEIIKNIHNLEDESKKIELYDLFIKQIKSMIIEYNYETEEALKEELLTIKNTLLEREPFIDLLLIDNKFDFENINNERIERGIKYEDEIEKEIDIMETEIFKLQKNLFDEYASNIISDKMYEIEEKIQNLSSDSKEKDKITKKYNSLITIKQSLNDSNNDLSGYDLFLIEKNNMTEFILKKIPEEIENKISILNNEINKIESNLVEIEKNINRAIEQYRPEELRVNNIYMNKTYDELKEIYEMLEIQKENLNDSTWKELQQKHDITMNNFFNANEIQTELEKIENELQIKKIEKEKEYNLQKITDLEIKITDQENNKITLEELNKLKSIDSTYKIIFKDAKEKFKNSKRYQNLEEKINNYVNKHQRINKLENNEKIQAELKKDILDSVKPRIVKKVEKKKKLWLKALAGTAGFALGLGLSSVSGIGTIRMALATTKLAGNLVGKAVNVYTKKHETGTIAKIKNGFNKKMNDINEKYPQLAKMVNGVKTFLKNPNVNWFINGVSIGYITGNVVELVTGKSVLEHLKDVKEPPAITVEDNYMQQLPTMEKPGISEINPNIENAPPINDTPIIEDYPITDSIPEVDDFPVIENTPIVEEIPVISEPIIPQQGEVFDLSELTHGFTRCDAPEAINIMESLGKEVTFDKAVELPNGKIMWHFKRLNGAGYAWFDSEVVQELLSKTTNTLSRVMR